MLEFAITPQSFILPPFTSSYLPPPPPPTFHFPPEKQWVVAAMTHRAHHAVICSEGKNLRARVRYLCLEGIFCSQCLGEARLTQRQVLSQADQVLTKRLELLLKAVYLLPVHRRVTHALLKGLLGLPQLMLDSLLGAQHLRPRVFMVVTSRWGHTRSPWNQGC